MIYVLATGTLFRDPKAETSKAGKPYASALLCAGDGDATLFINVRAFAEAADALLTLAKGDAVSVQGRADISVYEARDGQHKPSISVMVSALTPLRGGKPKPPASDDRPRQQQLAGTWTPGAGASDEIPFGRES